MHAQTQYWLLITMPDNTSMGLYAWQDKIEQICQPMAQVASIVMYTSTFQQWIKEQRRFAIRTLKEADVFYVQNEWLYTPTKEKPVGTETLKKVYNHGLMNARNFRAGGQFFLAEKQLHLAAFMLHQAAEQSLKTLLKIKTGFNSQTHNVLRLMGYIRFVIRQPAPACYSLVEKDRPLANLLQKAYTEARYKTHFQISLPDVEALTEKVKQICCLLEEEGSLAQ